MSFPDKGPYSGTATRLGDVVILAPDAEALTTHLRRYHPTTTFTRAKFRKATLTQAQHPLAKPKHPQAKPNLPSSP